MILLPPIGYQQKLLQSVTRSLMSIEGQTYHDPRVLYVGLTLFFYIIHICCAKGLECYRYSRFQSKHVIKTSVILEYVILILGLNPKVAEGSLIAQCNLPSLFG